MEIAAACLPVSLTPVSATSINVVAMSITSDESLVYGTTGGQDARSYHTDDMTRPVQQYFVDMERGTGVSLSPNGRYLAYAVQMMSAALGVFVLCPSDATVVSRTFVRVTERDRLVWAPDGSRIYLVLQRVSSAPTPPQPVLNVIRPVLPSRRPLSVRHYLRRISEHRLVGSAPKAMLASTSKWPAERCREEYLLAPTTNRGIAGSRATCAGRPVEL